MATPDVVAFAANPSESAALQGHKAKTPIIAGAVSGSCVGLAWIVGLAIYIYKRQRRKARARAAGLTSHRDLEQPGNIKEKYRIPPDPALAPKTIPEVAGHGLDPSTHTVDPERDAAGSSDSHTARDRTTSDSPSRKVPVGERVQSSVVQVDPPSKPQT
ncbi:hypothetical protein GLOTRDRAFT_104666 [Gloeophyllum trabeum ATCC 11539]|uniref:Uncharacterized protein n=1 Tax=Gloeophyllum trabeum (strain ATCC 11539 / FP-39264 / Madison 617) TaxID=670483 RepID=S7QAV2_GLOTA|nr:uncharacterized protein GLOTRDRAFT_104666 [Gloeophyllum trabeum ATCC 11539]EPQ57026.1 hypothetical protein GLOTRDRAFT_104666 [Gloeophyllum trabeum ATCC 11539]